MEYWNKQRVENGYGEMGIVLKGGNGRILSALKTDKGICFMEECDGCFSQTFTKDQALALIEELKQWIENN